MALKINDIKNKSNENVHLPRARKEKTHCNTTAVWILLTKGTSAGAKQIFMSKPEDGKSRRKAERSSTRGSKSDTMSWLVLSSTTTLSDHTLQVIGLSPKNTLILHQ